MDTSDTLLALEDRFALVAPKPPQWFVPEMSFPCPEQGARPVDRRGSEYPEEVQKQSKEAFERYDKRQAQIAEWRAEHERQVLAQWPYAYARMVLAHRPEQPAPAGMVGQ